MINEHTTYFENLKRLYVLQAARCETDEERQENNKVIERIEALMTRVIMTPLKGKPFNYKEWHEQQRKMAEFLEIQQHLDSLPMATLEQLKGEARNENQKVD